MAFLAGLGSTLGPLAASAGAALLPTAIETAKNIGSSILKKTGSFLSGLFGGPKDEKYAGGLKSVTRDIVGDVKRDFTAYNTNLLRPQMMQFISSGFG